MSICNGLSRPSGFSLTARVPPGEYHRANSWPEDLHGFMREIKSFGYVRGHGIKFCPGCGMRPPTPSPSQIRRFNAQKMRFQSQTFSQAIALAELSQTDEFMHMQAKNPTGDLFRDSGMQTSLYISDIGLNY